MTDKQYTATVKGLLSGAITGALEICCTYPIKYVKTQLQLEEKLGSARKYSGVIDCMKRTIAEHGVQGLYRGLNIFFYGPKSAIRFASFETFKSHLTDDKGVLSPTNRFLCGLYAGALEAALVNTPLETVEVKLINDLRRDKPRYRGFMHGAKLIYREEGFKGIYHGLLPSVLKQASNQGIRFFVVESLKSAYQQGDSTAAVPKLMTGLFGGFAGICSVMGNNPVDVVKTRMQGLGAERYNSTLDCFIKIWKAEGFLSFYRGLTPRLSRVPLEVALTFMIYDTIQDVFKLMQK